MATLMGFGFGKCQQSQKSNAFCGNATIIASRFDPHLLPEGCTSLYCAISMREALNQLCMCLEIAVLPETSEPPCFPLCLMLCSLVYT